MNDGFTFLAVVTGVTGAISIIGAGITRSDRSPNAGLMTVLASVLFILFLITGFAAFATR